MPLINNNTVWTPFPSPVFCFLSQKTPLKSCVYSVLLLSVPAALAPPPQLSLSQSQSSPAKSSGPILFSSCLTSQRSQAEWTTPSSVLSLAPQRPPSSVFFSSLSCFLFISQTPKHRPPQCSVLQLLLPSIFSPLPTVWSEGFLMSHLNTINPPVRVASLDISRVLHLPVE